MSWENSPGWVSFTLNFLQIKQRVHPDQTPRCAASDLGLHCLPMSESRPRGYKTFFMLKSAEHEICPANKSKISNKCKFFLAKHS